MNENKVTKQNKILSGLILLINIAGLACLLYYAIPYFTHDVTVRNPDAMLPAEAWDTAGMALTIGLFPLFGANLLAFLFVRLKPKYLRALFFLPCLICLTAVISYWMGA